LLQRKRQFAASIIAICALYAVPATAGAADTFVNDDGGNNANPCTQAQPCQTVAEGIARAGSGDDIFVDGGTYNESVTLPVGRSLRELNFNTTDGDSEALINGTGSTTITAGPGATTIDGFTIQGDPGVTVAGAATITNNVFDEPEDGTVGVNANEDAGGATIGPGNVFSDDGVDLEARIGVTVHEASSPVAITGNDFTDLSSPIRTFLTSVTITGNEITGTHAAGGLGGVAINVDAPGSPTIAANQIHSPDSDTGASGINLVGSSPGLGATLRRNRISDHDPGVLVGNTTLPVTLNSDVIMGAATAGLQSEDVDPIGTGQGDVSATNVTFSNSNIDILLDDTTLTLDSSLLASGNSIQEIGTPSCSISFSRGQTTSGDSCQTFQTNAAPMLAPDGYHLLAGSPMIDMGDPTPPVAPNDLDVDGDPRAIDENCDGTARRNIGADEIPTTCGGSGGDGGGTTTPPAGGTTTTPTLTPTAAPPPPPPARKKCKRKKKGAAAAKKCKRRK
jgi:hypothetical protein